ncbi:MAG TPA: hypothetical protein PKX28_05065 [Candidatus Hydrogenedentes bacterium]|nr:hypothetical protein [Candidatus Hydrogenedentota bacterium]HOJ68453.1 hypothetical protein [Candidatus Hydrogenedentota bacterium]HOK88465.1 hypothetical protein [Candidatus Hydrogenedentota bacterium]HOV60733.1 hypothetical protein [Candidatus Hydrogenedentota bacterium]HPO30588.1 hypothetical protein [Candidatus Hydrogenedentota bacterium]
MFFALLSVTLLISLATSYGVSRVFRHPIQSILDRVVSSEISGAWRRYLEFAIIVVGVSGGVRISELERYITREGVDAEPLRLTPERWILEVYRTLVDTLSSIAWMLLVFFIFALIAYVLVRGFEMRRLPLAGSAAQSRPPDPPAS